MSEAVRGVAAGRFAAGSLALNIGLCPPPRPPGIVAPPPDPPARSETKPAPSSPRRSLSTVLRPLFTSVDSSGVFDRGTSPVNVVRGGRVVSLVTLGRPSATISPVAVSTPFTTLPSAPVTGATICPAETEGAILPVTVIGDPVVVGAVVPATPPPPNAPEAARPAPARPTPPSTAGRILLPASTTICPGMLDARADPAVEPSADPAAEPAVEPSADPVASVKVLPMTPPPKSWPLTELSAPDIAAPLRMSPRLRPWSVPDAAEPSAAPRGPARTVPTRGRPMSAIFPRTPLFGSSTACRVNVLRSVDPGAPV